MKYRQFQDLQLSALGFGLMRLPTKQDGAIDEDCFASMVDRAMERGVNYFDTAYPYHGGMSEIVAGKVLNRHPRDSFYLASKYPGHQYAKTYHPDKIFEEQLKKCRVDYFDFYLLHNVMESCIDVYKDPQWGILDYFVEQKRRGRIRHLGFSSHAGLETLRDFLDYAGDAMEFCQIQLNYLDWTLQNARARYELLTERGLPVWVMEPVRGGRLSALSDDQTARLRALRPEASTASWCFRWLQGLPNVTMVLSGMSSPAQLEDNLDTFSTDAPLSEEEMALLYQIAAELQTIIPCTGCRYCCDSCPQKLNIPELLSLLNDARFGANFTVAMRLEALPDDRLPSACIACGTCTHACPQNIPIPDLMREFADMRPKLPSWRKICEERALAAAKLKK